MFSSKHAAPKRKRTRKSIRAIRTNKARHDVKMLNLSKLKLYMFGFYVPILLLQAFCIYHAYRNNAEQRWFWLIVLFPFIGSLVYLVHHFNNRTTLDTLKENVKEVVSSNYRLEQLEKALRFSDNLQNKLNLADAYTELGRYDKAIDLYSDCLQGFMADDPGIRLKLLNVYYLNGNYEAAVECGNNLVSEKRFKNSEGRVAYAWSLFHTGKTVQAERVFEDMDTSFTNYYHRLEYCKFLLKTEKSDSAKEKLTSLLQEFEQMQGGERRLKKEVFRELKDLYANSFRVV